MYWWSVEKHHLHASVSSNLWYPCLYQPSQVMWRSFVSALNLLMSSWLTLAGVLRERGSPSSETLSQAVSKTHLQAWIYLLLLPAHKNIWHFYWLEDLLCLSVCIYLISPLFALLCHITWSFPGTFKTAVRAQPVTHSPQRRDENPLVLAPLLH